MKGPFNHPLYEFMPGCSILAVLADLLDRQGEWLWPLTKAAGHIEDRQDDKTARGHVVKLTSLLCDLANIVNCLTDWANPEIRPIARDQSEVAMAAKERLAAIAVPALKFFIDELEQELNRLAPIIALVAAGKLTALPDGRVLRPSPAARTGDAPNAP